MNLTYHIKDVIHERNRNTFLCTNNPVKGEKSEFHRNSQYQGKRIKGGKGHK
jgi:hypothetical protein